MGPWRKQKKKSIAGEDSIACGTFVRAHSRNVKVKGTTCQKILRTPVLTDHNEETKRAEQDLSFHL